MQPRIINFGRWFPKFCKILSLQAVDQLLKSISVPRTESVNIKCSSLLQRREGVFRKIYILWIFWYLRWFTSWWRGNNLHSELVKCFSKDLVYFVLIWFSTHCLTLCHLIKLYSVSGGMSSNMFNVRLQMNWIIILTILHVKYLLLWFSI